MWKKEVFDGNNFKSKKNERVIWETLRDEHGKG